MKHNLIIVCRFNCYFYDSFDVRLDKSTFQLLLVSEEQTLEKTVVNCVEIKNLITMQVKINIMLKEQIYISCFMKL